MRHLFFLLTLLLSSAFIMAQDYSKDYQAIEALAKEGKYRSALDLATTLYQTAERDGDQDDMVKALAHRAAYTLELEEEGTEATLRLLIAELESNRNRPVVSPILNYLIGMGYYTYAQQNAYRLRNATAVTTDGEPAADTPLEDWNLRQLADAADRYLYAAISEAGQQRTQLSAIPAIIANSDSDAEGITLYDLLVENIGNALNNPLLVVNNTAPAAAPTWLAPAVEFVALEFAGLDEKTGPARRLKLHQEQLRYHLASGGPGLLRADIRRVEYVRQLGAEAEDYLAALKRMYSTYADVPGRDILLVKQAQVYANQAPEDVEKPKVIALRLLDEVTEDTPEIHNAEARLRAEILRKTIQTTVPEAYQTGDNLLIQQSYRNVSTIYQRLVKLNDARYAEYVDGRNDEDQYRQLLAGNVVAEKSFRLAENDDYETHQTETWLPKQAAGAYVLLTSSERDFANQENTSHTLVIVTGMAVVKFDDGEQDYYEVQDLQTGAPRPGIQVSIHVQEGRRRGTEWKNLRTVVTDDQGRFTMPSINRQRFYLVLRDGQDVLYTPADYFYEQDRRNRNREQNFTPLFTDRAIYRPGQTVNVYGITMLKDRNSMPTLLTGQARKLQLRDANYQEIEVKTATSDEFGRFDLSFVLPEGGLTGTFRLETDGGSVAFQVEEYKRPRFEVEVDGPDYVVGGEEATFTGKATLFAGPALNDAAVNYKIFVEQRRWYWWYRGDGGGGERELVDFGQATTDENGEFTIVFTPDENLAEQRLSYEYTIEVDVADETGETHSGKTTAALRSDKPSVSLNVADDYQVGDSLIINAAAGEESLDITYSISRVDNPNASLIDRRWEFPDRPVLSEREYRDLFPDLPATERVEPKEWPVENRVVNQRQLSLEDGKGNDKLLLDGYAVGYYRIDWTYPDGTAGEPVIFKVSDLENSRLPEGVLYTVSQQEKMATLGQPIEISLYSAVDLPRITYSFISRKGVNTAVTNGGRKATFTYVPREADRGGIMLDVAFVYNGVLHEERFNVEFGWDNKKLAIDYATFRDKLRPGEPETWTLTVRNADGSPVNAAALASMYDASLDEITPAGPWGFDPYPNLGRYRNFATMYLSNTRSNYLQIQQKGLDLRDSGAQPRLDLSPFNWNSYNQFGGRPMPVNAMARQKSSAPEADGVMYEANVEEQSLEMEPPRTASPPPPPPGGAAPADEDTEAPVSIRKNLQETAFWLPELTTNDGGDLVVSFTSPEALTRWRFRVLTHDRQVNYGYSEQEIVTQKELMILPNVPRFLREGDALELTARVNNMTGEDMTVRATIEFFDPETDEVIAMGAAAGAKECIEEQVVGAKSGKSFCFPLNIPDGFSSRGPLGYRMIARGGNFSDGEENVFPVLTDRTLVTVTQAFYLKKKDDKEVTIPLLANYDSGTLQHVGYTFEATTNPAWIALKSLPYLMEYPYDCTEQVANRYFANQLAFVTVSNKPILETVFRKWQADSNALKSELEQNASLKNALLTETPWVRAAQSETEQRARIAQLFDLKALAAGQTKALDKLVKRQAGGGYYSWFPGGPDNRYITQYVVETLARMRQLNVITPDQTDQVDQIIDNATTYLDRELADDYRDLLDRKKKDDKIDLDKYQPSSHVVHYLYARALAGAQPVAGEEGRKAMAYYRSQVLKLWTDYGLYEQALIASMGSASGGDAAGKAVAKTIVESLRERAIRKDEFGMYWKYNRGFRWTELPIETHCRILEAFQMGGGTTEELDEMRLWLLTNKRTNRWHTTKSTAAAVYALLNTGTDWVANDGKTIQVKWPLADRGLGLGDQLDRAQNSAEAATGAFSIRVAGENVSKGLATVEVKNKANNLVWGGVYWQYTELAAKVEASNGGPLTLERQLFHRIPTDGGMRLDPITADNPLAPGDRVTVRLIIRSDRDLDFVHVKDRRAATFEPIEQLSGYQFSNRLGYYFAPGDLATNFFIDDLPKGTHTIEYDLFATYSGSFSNGLGRIQCMYAPEFGANTAGAMITVE